MLRPSLILFFILSIGADTYAGSFNWRGVLKGVRAERNELLQRGMYGGKGHWRSLLPREVQDISKARQIRRQLMREGQIVDWPVATSPEGYHIIYHSADPYVPHAKSLRIAGASPEEGKLLFSLDGPNSIYLSRLDSIPHGGRGYIAPGAGSRLRQVFGQATKGFDIEAWLELRNADAYEAVANSIRAGRAPDWASVPAYRAAGKPIRITDLADGSYIAPAVGSRPNSILEAFQNLRVQWGSTNSPPNVLNAAEAIERFQSRVRP